MSEIAAQYAADSRVKPVWRRAGVLAAGLIVTLAVGAMLAKIVVARVPQQRASIERALRTHTGLDIRFSKMHVGWGFRGAQAQLTDVRIADTAASRFRATAPQVHVNFDTWGLFRGGELSLGRVTLVRAVIDVDLSKLEQIGVVKPSRPTNKNDSLANQSTVERAALDSVARVLRALPAGRVELEAATLRLTGAPQFSAQNLQITRAVLRREADSATAYATFLLPAELGKTAFVSVDARGLFTRGAAFDANARVITRQLRLAGVAPDRRIDGSVTLDARAHVTRGVLTDASWQVNMRRMAMFDRAASNAPLTYSRADFNGALRREADHWRVTVENLHIAPAAGAGRSAEFVVDARADGLSGVMTSHAVPIPVLQFLLAVGSPADQYVWPHELPADAGTLHNVKFEWGTRGGVVHETHLNADVEQAAVFLADAGLRLEGVRGRLQGSHGKWHFEFAPDAPIRVFSSGRDVGVGMARVSGAIGVEQHSKGVVVRAEDIRATSNNLKVGVSGRVESQPAGLVDLSVAIDDWDTDAARQYLQDLAPKSALLAALEPLSAGRIVNATATVSGIRGADGALLAKDSQVKASVSLQDIHWHLRGREEHLVDADVVIRHENGATTATISGGRVGDINIVSANLNAAPDVPTRIRATALAALDSRSLRKAMPELARLNAAGDALLELQATVPVNSQAPVEWRGTVRLSDANFFVARGVPPIGDVRGAVTFVDGSPRRSTLAGRWLGGDIRIAVSERQSRGRAQRFALRGVATAAALAQWMGVDDGRALDGDFAWSGTLDWDRQRSQGAIIIESGLTGLSSTLPEPFAKRATRALPIVGRFDFDTDGVRKFELHANRKSFARGSVREQQMDAVFAVADLRGTIRGSSNSGDWRVSVDTLRVDQVPQILAVANSVARTPTSATFELLAGELRDTHRAYGALRARFEHNQQGFVLEQVAAPSLYRGDNVRLACREQCQLTWQVAASDPSGVLELLGARPSLAALEWRSAGALSWPAAASPELIAMTGRAEVDLTDGSWSSTPSPHAASFADAALAPVAALRPGGVAFEHIQASFEFDEGAARVTNWRMNLPDGDLTARGQLDIADRRHELELDWRPDSQLPSSVADLTSRPRLAAAWAALRARVGAVPPVANEPAQSTVRLGGTWSAPVLIAPDLIAQD